MLRHHPGWVVTGMGSSARSAVAEVALQWDGSASEGWTLSSTSITSCAFVAVPVALVDLDVDLDSSVDVDGSEATRGRRPHR
jgi:hypothetical protein